MIHFQRISSSDPANAEWLSLGVRRGEERERRILRFRSTFLLAGRKGEPSGGICGWPAKSLMREAVGKGRRGCVSWVSAADVDDVGGRFGVQYRVVPSLPLSFVDVWFTRR